MIQVALIGITGVFLALQIRSAKPELSVYLGIATSLLILLLAVDKLSVVLEGIRTIQEHLSIHAAYIQALLKIIGITYVAEFASDICKDAGYGTLAGQIGIFSKLSILAVSMPVLTALLETIHGFLGG
ncbi:MAG: stage III sporulation protein AD [Lachnospiraceae bacterium]|nr:stage III sporulation protein AD [Lachnospiraceae bacterium]MCI8994648.1 stage III sporulation protein AD [Lachnospiraceae bacterium]MCI9133283.1 stage III sporulation protein AD [Lachnospiraceae bacterium]